MPPAIVPTNVTQANGRKVPVVPVLMVDANGSATTVTGGGGGSGDASANNQTIVQANPGSDATKAIAIQGVTGAKPIPTTVSANVAVLKTGTWNIDSIVANVSVVQAGSWSIAQSGNWDVRNISGTITLPTGAATSAKQDSVIAGIGANSDPVWSSGNGSVVSLLKTIATASLDTSTPVPITSNTIGTGTDTSGANTLIGQLKASVAVLQAIQTATQNTYVEPARLSVKSSVIQIDVSTAKSLANVAGGSIPSGTQYIVVQADGGDARFTLQSLNTPTASTGFKVPQDSMISLNLDDTSLGNMKLFGTKVNVMFLG